MELNINEKMKEELDVMLQERKEALLKQIRDLEEQDPDIYEQQKLIIDSETIEQMCEKLIKEYLLKFAHDKFRKRITINAQREFKEFSDSLN